MVSGGSPFTVPVLRLLTFRTLYPNSVEPNHGVFVGNRLRHLLAGGGVEARVLAPVPCFPFGAELFGGDGMFAKVPAVKRLFARCPDRDTTRRYAEGLSWDMTSHGQLGMFREIVASGR